MPDPEISILMSVHQGERYLREAIDSLLAQSFSDFELIVIDDASHDGTPKILDEYAQRDPRVRVHSQAIRCGLARSLNRGIRLSRGRFIARQDADDVSLPSRLELQRRELLERPEIGLLGAAYYLLDSSGRIGAKQVQPEDETEIRWQMLFHNAFCHSSVMFRRDLCREDENFYDESLEFSQDYECWSRLLQRTRGTNLREPLVGFRMHAASASATRNAAQQAIALDVAERAVHALDPGLSREEISFLRQSYYGSDTRLDSKRLRVWTRLFDLLATFAAETPADSHALRRISLRHARHMLRRTPLRLLPELWRSGMFTRLLRIVLGGLGGT